MIVDRDQIQIDAVALENDCRAPRDELTDTAFSKAAAYGDALRVLPFFEPQKRWIITANSCENFSMAA
jgi:hypothetical protein